MKIIYFVALPAIVIAIGLFLIVNEVSKALERSVGKIGAFYDLRLHKDPVIVFSTLNQNLMENQSIFDLNITNARVDIKLCKKIKTEMINDAVGNDEKSFTSDANEYEKGHCEE